MVCVSHICLVCWCLFWWVCLFVFAVYYIQRYLRIVINNWSLPVFAQVSLHAPVPAVDRPNMSSQKRRRCRLSFYMLEHIGSLGFFSCFLFSEKTSFCVRPNSNGLELTSATKTIDQSSIDSHLSIGRDLGDEIWQYFCTTSMHFTVA